MKALDKSVKKVLEVASWTHLTNEEKSKKIKDILLDVYDLGHINGYSDCYYDNLTE